VKYTKPPLTFEAQADLLISRGMGGDRDLMIARLTATNYYRLSGYWHPFREPNPTDTRSPLDTFKPGTTFEQVWSRYLFDRRLRLLVMDAVERIEVGIGTQLTYLHAHDHGPFAYATEPASMPKLDADQFAEFVGRVREEVDRSKDVFANHFRLKYGDCHDFLPAWMLAEVMTFGTMLNFYRGTSRKVKQGVATQFGLPEPVFDSWLLTLNAVRNICAHHGRLWNRELGVKPFIPRINEYPMWHTPVKVNNNRLFSVLTICKWSLDRIAPQSSWPSRVRSLIATSPDIPLASMGFPINWSESSIWKFDLAQSS
jgi:abortive infection bacteriophage resistance protein